VPQPGLTPNESRFAAVCRLLAVLYFSGALALAVWWTALAPEAGFAVLALAMMTAVATACLVAAAQPRERRHAALPAIVAPLTATLVGGALLISGNRSPALIGAVATGVPLFALTTLAYRAAAPGVRSAPPREAPPPALEEAAPMKLKVSKS